MLDNELIKIFVPIINSGFVARGIDDVTVIQAYQPTQEGITGGRTVYFHKLYDHRYGFLKRSSVWDPDLSQMIHTELQNYETTFQVDVLAIQDPTDTSSLTASDIANIAAATLQSDVARSIFTSYKIGVYRITDVRNTYFLDDKNRQEALPSFDFTLTHTRSEVTVIEPVSGIDSGIYRI